MAKTLPVKVWYEGSGYQVPNVHPDGKVSDLVKSMQGCGIVIPAGKVPKLSMTSEENPSVSIFLRDDTPVLLLDGKKLELFLVPVRVSLCLIADTEGETIHVSKDIAPDGKIRGLVQRLLKDVASNAKLAPMLQGGNKATVMHDDEPLNAEETPVSLNMPNGGVLKLTVAINKNQSSGNPKRSAESQLIRQSTKKTKLDGSNDVPNPPVAENDVEVDDTPDKEKKIMTYKGPPKVKAPQGYAWPRGWEQITKQRLDPIGKCDHYFKYLPAGDQMPHYVRSKRIVLRDYRRFLIEE